MAWFRNLVQLFGENIVIRVARKDGQPIAAIFTVRFKKRVVYKYGCSDPSRHNLGGIPLLIWEAICDASRQGIEEFDMGRSEPDNPGLIKFKDRWGAVGSELTYRRYSSEPAVRAVPGEQHALAGRILAALPDVCFAAAGRLLYKHVG
jgi:lipid II:glycine glycyltransferase (peptidoglycan interpeptide bridge formation enzyme)